MQSTKLESRTLFWVPRLECYSAIHMLWLHALSKLPHWVKHRVLVYFKLYVKNLCLEFFFHSEPILKIGGCCSNPKILMGNAVLCQLSVLPCVWLNPSQSWLILSTLAGRQKIVDSSPTPNTRGNHICLSSLIWANLLVLCPNNLWTWV